MTKIDFSIIIPVYRASKQNINQILKRLNQLGLNTFEVIFVYDCGLASTKQFLLDAVNSHYNVKTIFLTKNFGQHNATICGIEHAKGNWIITMDEDLQHDPLEISKIINKQKEGNYDVVYGKYHELNHSIFRNFTSLTLKSLLRIGIPSLHQDFTSFRLIRSEIGKQLVKMNNSYTFLDGYLSWITNAVASVEVIHNKSEAGKSSYSLKKLVEHSINIFITFSNLPIRLLTILSFIFIIFSFSYTVYIIGSSLITSNYEAGFPTFIAFLGFGFGLVLFGLGVVGEYISTINFKTTNRPNFVIKEIKESNDSVQ